MLTATEIAGFAGAGLAGAAYVPQISHLISARCSAGISRLAFEAWLLASVLTTARAIAIGAGVFIVLGGIQIVATTVIMVCAIRYKDTPCPVHLPGRPTATMATGAGVPGNGPGPWHPPGRLHPDVGYLPGKHPAVRLPRRRRDRRGWPVADGPGSSRDDAGVHGSTVLYPSDATSTANLVAQMAEHSGVVYMRTTRGAYPILYGPG